MNRNHFESNQRYFTICIYTVFVILAACIIFRVIFHWDETAAVIRHFLSSMSGFLVGILIAFIVNPLVNVIHEKWFSDVVCEEGQKKPDAGDRTGVCGGTGAYGGVSCLYYSAADFQPVGAFRKDSGHVYSVFKLAVEVVGRIYNFK